LNLIKQKTANLSISGFSKCGGEIEILTLPEGLMLQTLHLFFESHKAKNPSIFLLTGFSKCGGEIEI